MERTIALLTDFGTDDIYVGTMKGVIHSLYPAASFIDITHAVRPHHVREAAFALLNSYRYFAEGTIFVVVVDPGVGTSRRPIAVQVGGYTLLAPDNGVLTYALAEFGRYDAVELSNPEYRLPYVSNTFHGRDVFAPAAAYIAAGTALSEFGEWVGDLVTLPLPELSVMGKSIRGEVVHIDRFGNIVTSIGQLRWTGPGELTLDPRFGDKVSSGPFPATDVVITMRGQPFSEIRQTYDNTQRGAILALVDSNGYLEIAANQDNAATRLSAAIGDRVEVQIG